MPDPRRLALGALPVALVIGGIAAASFHSEELSLTSEDPSGGEAGAHTGANAQPTVVLPGPTLADWEIGAHDDGPPGRAPTMALAYQYDTRVFAKPREQPKPIGVVRRGTQLPVQGEQVEAPGCKNGGWFKLLGRGFVCTADGFSVSSKPMKFDVRQLRPDTASPLPYVYGQVTERTALRYYRLPSEAEERAAREAVAQGATELPEVVAEQLDGDYFVAIDRKEQSADREFYRTIRGRYVRVDHVELRPETEMHGVHLDADRPLPIAFVYGGDAPAYRVAETGTERLGIARKHARFPMARSIPADESGLDAPLVVGADGIGVPRNHLRIARRVERPADVPAGARWVHVDLTEQTLVAYEGDAPLFATLVSSGREDGFATPAGLFQMHAKHISSTMRGEDPVEGVYDVEEVPWTMYYWEGFALHGAYWHEDFGKTRSHGCTNLAPADARWLYYWSRPKVPKGWHGVTHAQGTWVYLSREQDEQA